MNRLKLLICFAGLALIAGAQDRKSMCLVLDLRSMNGEEQARAQSAALKLVDEKMGATDQVIVMTVTSEVKAIQDFSGDREVVKSALRRIVLAPVNSPSDADERLRAIQSASEILQAVPGKKQLLYFSAATNRGAESKSKLEAAINSAVRANVAIYAIDVRQ